MYGVLVMTYQLSAFYSRTLPSCYGVWPEVSKWLYSYDHYFDSQILFAYVHIQSKCIFSHPLNIYCVMWDMRTPVLLHKITIYYKSLMLLPQCITSSTNPGIYYVMWDISKPCNFSLYIKIIGIDTIINFVY